MLPGMKEDAKKSEKSEFTSASVPVEEPKAPEAKKEDANPAASEAERLASHYDTIYRAFTSAKNLLEQMVDAGAKLPAFPQNLVGAAKDFLARQ